MPARKLFIAVVVVVAAGLFATSMVAAKAKPTFYCDMSTKPPCFGSMATVNAKKTRLTDIAVKGPHCIRENGSKVKDSQPTFRDTNVKLTGKKKNKFSVNGEVPLYDAERGDQYLFPYTMSGTVRHGKSISVTVKVTGAVEPCANIKKISVKLTKR